MGPQAKALEDRDEFIHFHFYGKRSAEDEEVEKRDAPQANALDDRDEFIHFHFYGKRSAPLSRDEFVTGTVNGQYVHCRYIYGKRSAELDEKFDERDTPLANAMNAKK